MMTDIDALVERLTAAAQLDKSGKGFIFNGEIFGETAAGLLDLRAERDALRADAKRYRTLKGFAEDYDGHVTFPEVAYRVPIPDRSPWDAIDDAVDALTPAEPKEQQT